MIYDEELLQKNVELNLEKERKKYRKLDEKAERLSRNEFLLGHPFTLVKDEHVKAATAITVIPPAVMTAIAIPAGFLTMIAGYFYLASQGATVSPEEMRVINTITNFFEKTGTFTANTLALAIKTAVVPLSFGTVCLSKEIIETKKSEKQEEVLYKMEFIRDIIKMLREIKTGRRDPSLNFIKEFLSVVDLSKNKGQFNTLIFSRLVNCRNAYKDVIEGKKGKRTIEESMEQLVEALTEDNLEYGADKTFINHPYIKNIVNTYKKIEDEHKTK